MKLENSIQASLIKGINKFPGCKAIAIIVTGGMEVGTPDVDACILGRCTKIETKREDQVPTPIQEWRIKEWEEAGADCYVLIGQAQVDEYLSTLEAKIADHNAPQSDDPSH